MSLTLLYFVSAGFCIILSIFIILTCLLLKLEKFILLCGVYFALVGIVSVFFALLYTYPLIPVYRELVLLIWFFGLSSAYPLFALARPLNGVQFYRWATWVMLTVIVVFQAIIVYELVFASTLLFWVGSGVVILKPLVRFVFIPFALTGHTILAFFVALLCRVIEQRYKRLMKIMSCGVFCMLVFESVDFYNTYIRPEPLEEYYYVYNFGVLLFALLFSAMLIQYVRGKMYVSVSQDVLFGNDSYLLQIYQKAVKKIKARQYYADDTITIGILARLLSENRNELSKAINLYYRGNFSSFMNSFRVEELKRLLAVPDQNFSILEMGFKVGF